MELNIGLGVTLVSYKYNIKECSLLYPLSNSGGTYWGEGGWFRYYLMSLFINSLSIHISISPYHLVHSTNFSVARSHFLPKNITFKISSYRIIKGVNNLGIEANCDWAVPKKTW